MVNAHKTSTAQHSSRIVQHRYQDHVHDKAPAYVCDNMFVVPSGPAGDPFPVRLLKVLDQTEADGHSHIISWQPHGRCFLIRNIELFNHILPKYFNQSKIASFQRQLNLYGFQRITRGVDRGAYYHELFLRGKGFLAHQIVRTKVKGTKVRAKSNPDQEPDFWSMEWVPATSTTSVPHQTQNESECTNRVSGCSQLTFNPNGDKPDTLISVSSSSVASCQGFVPEGWELLLEPRPIPSDFESFALPLARKVSVQNILEFDMSDELVWLGDENSIDININDDEASLFSDILDDILEL